ncbi:MAG: putative Formyl-CoA transferase [Frankiales bacterium]|nr:putative Formyl-CoA transferase [Frankiales bacterium]
MSGAYDGLRVLDASRSGTGAMATMYFADQGADVVRVLPPGRQPVDNGPGHLCWDRNKVLCALDRESPAGAADLLRLIGAADVAVFDEPLHELAGAGLDADSLLRENARLVHLWLPLLGPAEPWGSLPPDPLLADAVTGVSGEHGSYDGGPVALVTPLPAYAQAVLGATAAAAALIERHRSGRGQGVLVSGLHATAALQAATLTDAEGILRYGQSGGGSSPSYRLYPCSDGRWIYLGALTEPLFLTALDVLDLLDVLVLPGMDGEVMNMLKPDVGPAVLDLLQRRFRERPRHEWEQLLTAAGVPNAPAQTRDEWWQSDVVAASGLRRREPHPDLGDVEFPGDQLTFSRTPGSFSHLPGPGAFVPGDRIWTDPLPEPPASTGLAEGPPLAGLRVLDLGSFVAGPFGASLLGDFGAEVVKVEGPDGDAYRAFAISFLAFHKGQQNVVLDLKSEVGRQTLHRLVADADVLLDNVRPGVRERVGTDYATLAAVNPRLVRGTVTAWGPGNSLSATPAFDPLLQARSGLLVAQGGDAAPCQSAMLIHDIGTGATIAFGILAALFARHRDGLGQEVVTTMANTSLAMQSAEFVRYDGRPELRAGGHDYVGESALHRLYACSDAWIAVAATTVAHAEGVRRALGLPEVPGLSAPAEGAVARAVAAGLARLPAADVVARLAAEGVPAAPVLPSGGFLHDPWIHDSRMFTTIDDPDFGACTVVRTYADWSRSRHDITTPAAAPGADTVDVLRGSGFPEQEIDELLEAGVVRRPRLREGS